MSRKLNLFHETEEDPKLSSKKVLWVIIPVAIIVGIFVCLTISCSGSSNENETKTTTTPDATPEAMFTEITFGNRTYLAFTESFGEGIRLSNEDDQRSIRRCVQEYERKHPELEVTSGSFERSIEWGYGGSIIYGIWIDHRPKEVK